jgi:glyceraldehyde 3-phosphate dehydrogenase
MDFCFVNFRNLLIMIRVAINGFGRIGRLSLRSMLTKSTIEIVAINDLTDAHTLAHLFKYDSIHGKFNGTISANNQSISINGKSIRIFAEREPQHLAWKDLNIDVVLECTGKFRTKEEAGLHIQAGAKKVLISAPPKGAGVKSIVLGINENTLTKEDAIISNASCTTNCVAPMVKILDDLCEIESGIINTVHAYTSDQRLHDSPHSDLRRARAAAVSIIPTSTGAAKAIANIFPNLKGKIEGGAMRVPVPNASLTDFVCMVKNPLSAALINEAFKKQAESSLKGILEYSTEPLVSTDIIGNTHSCIFDSELTVVNGKLVKIVGWYDNEMGYSSRMADLIELL